MLIQVTIAYCSNYDEQSLANPESWEPKFSYKNSLINPDEFMFVELSDEEKNLSGAYTRATSTSSPSICIDIVESLDCIYKLSGHTNKYTKYNG